MEYFWILLSFLEQTTDIMKHRKRNKVVLLISFWIEFVRISIITYAFDIYITPQTFLGNLHSVWSFVIAMRKLLRLQQSYAKIDFVVKKSTIYSRFLYEHKIKQRKFVRGKLTVLLHRIFTLERTEWVILRL